MSWEGYEQVLCENGHLSIHDPYNYMFMEREYWDQWECRVCGGKKAWSNLVDQTNGSHEINELGEEVRVDGFVELEVATPAKVEKCHCCGHEKVAEEEIYKIPQREKR